MDTGFGNDFDDKPIFLSFQSVEYIYIKLLYVWLYMLDVEEVEKVEVEKW